MRAKRISLFTVCVSVFFNECIDTFIFGVLEEVKQFVQAIIIKSLIQDVVQIPRGFLQKQSLLFRPTSQHGSC